MIKSTGNPGSMRSFKKESFDSVGGINKNKTIHCYFSKERQISIVMFIQSNLLFLKYSPQLEIQEGQLKKNLTSSTGGVQILFFGKAYFTRKRSNNDIIHRFYNSISEAKTREFFVFFMSFYMKIP